MEVHRNSPMQYPTGEDMGIACIATFTASQSINFRNSHNTERPSVEGRISMAEIKEEFGPYFDDFMLDIAVDTIYFYGGLI